MKTNSKRLKNILLPGLLMFAFPSFAQDETSGDIVAEEEIIDVVEAAETADVAAMDVDVGIDVATNAVETMIEDVIETESDAIAEEDAMPNVPDLDMPVSEETDEIEVTERVEGVTSNTLLSVNFEGVPLDTVVRFISLNAGVSIIIPEGLDKNVTATLYDQEWRAALETILDVEGYVLLEKRGGIYTIKSKTDIDADPLVLEKLEFKYITVEDALPVIEDMLTSSNSTVTALERANVIYISETATRIQEIRALLEEVDLPRKQVFIEAKFVELNDQAIEDLGINWTVLQGYTVRAAQLGVSYTDTTSKSTQDAQVFLNSRIQSDARGFDDATDQSFSDVAPDFNLSDAVRDRDRTSRRNTLDSRANFDALVQGRNFEDFDLEEGTITTLPNFQAETIRSAVLTADEFSLTLSALKQLDGVRIVSNPKMLVANGEAASIHVGRQEPNITAALVEGENVSSYVYGLDEDIPFIDIGVKLDVKPVIYTERNISLVIAPQLSRLIGQKSAGDAALEFPVVSTRTINTEFALESGKTVAIGGLTEGQQRETVNKVPVLGSIPVLGKYLFTHTHTEDIQDEIIVFVSVEMAHVEAINATHGIPAEGRLIQTWLQQNAGGSPKIQEKSIEEILSGSSLGETE